MRRRINRLVKKKIAACALVMLSAAAILSGCGKSSDKDGSGIDDSAEQELINVGFSQLGAESDWRLANTESIRRSLTKQNGFMLNFDDAQQKQDKQVLAIRKFTQQEVDCIVLAPVMETGWDTVLQEAKDAGIPVVIVDRRVNVSDKTLFTAWVGSDFRREADIACEWLRSFTEAKGIEPEELNIVDIQGTLGATAQIERSNGLSNAARKYGWNLLAQVPADYAQAKANEVMINLLSEYENINVVYCENDNEAAGAIEAIEESGRTVGTDIKNGEILIISFDAAHSGLSLVMQGKIALDVECNPLQGDNIAKLVKAIHNDEDFTKYTYVPEKAFALDDTVKSVNLEDGGHEITILTDEVLQGREY